MFLDLLKGLSVTFLHLFKKPSTISYPEQNLPTRPRPRGRHFLDRYEDGLEKCIGCSLCAAACPSKAIFVQAAENTEEKRFSPGERYAEKYEINLLRCIFCGFCVEACPTGAIQMSDQYEFSETSRDDFLYDREKLLVKSAADRPKVMTAVTEETPMIRYDLLDKGA